MRFKQAVAIAGTHGKTTTTSMVAALLDAGGLDPTVINGGIINAYGTNARMGAGDWMVVEADESDGTFLKLPADVAVVTNIDPEHLDHYGNFDKVREAFRQFVENVPFYGFAVMCTDHPEVQALVGADRGPPHHHLWRQPAGRRALHRPPRRRRGVAASTSSSATARPAATHVIEDLACRCPASTTSRTPPARSPSPHELGIPADGDPQGLAGFGGVKRRFTHTGTLERRRDLRRLRPPSGRDRRGAEGGALGRRKGRVIAVAQPHRFTRLRDLFDEFCACFNDADTVIVAPVYAAGEAPIEGVDRDALVEGLRARGHRDARAARRAARRSAPR